MMYVSYFGDFFVKAPVTLSNKTFCSSVVNTERPASSLELPPVLKVEPARLTWKAQRVDRFLEGLDQLLLECGHTTHRQCNARPTSPLENTELELTLSAEKSTNTAKTTKKSPLTTGILIHVFLQ